MGIELEEVAKIPENAIDRPRHALYTLFQVGQQDEEAARQLDCTAPHRATCTIEQILVLDRED